MIINIKSTHLKQRSHLKSITETKQNEENHLANKVVSHEIKNVETRRDQLKKTS